MKITGIKYWQVDLPLCEGRYSWSGGNFMEVFDSTVVAVETDAGITGYAECCPLGSAYLPSYARGVRAGLGEDRAEVNRARSDRSVAASTITWMPCFAATPMSRRPSTSRAGTYWGRSPACPCTNCWAAPSRKRSRSTGPSARKTPPANGRKDCRLSRAEGYTKFQLKVGGDPADFDIARIKACRALSSPPTDILVADANTGWTKADAARVVNAVRDLDVYIEQPC